MRVQLAKEINIPLSSILEDYILQRQITCRFCQTPFEKGSLSCFPEPDKKFPLMPPEYPFRDVFGLSCPWCSKGTSL